MAAIRGRHGRRRLSGCGGAQGVEARRRPVLGRVEGPAVALGLRLLGLLVAEVATQAVLEPWPTVLVATRAGSALGVNLSPACKNITEDNELIWYYITSILFRKKGVPKASESKMLD